MAGEQLEKHQSGATTESRELRLWPLKKGGRNWSHWSSVNGREMNPSFTEAAVSGAFFVERGLPERSKGIFWTSYEPSFAGKKFQAWSPCYLNRFFNLPRWPRGRSVQTSVHSHAATLDAACERDSWGTYLFYFPSNWVLLGKSSCIKPLFF